jgi:peptidoglycan/xylan/chitin deacetylase (PgdA/CDA1 family)
MVDSSSPCLTVARFPKNARSAVTSSWDDNDNANMEIMEILDSMNLRGTFYVDLGSPRWRPRKQPVEGLTDSELRSLSARHELGSHTWTHVDVRDCDSRRLREELTKSKESIEIITGQSVLGYSYPYGSYSALCQSIARECLYQFGRASFEGVIDFPPSNPYLWGITVFATERSPHFLKTLVSKRTILTRKGRLYLKNVAADWRGLALRLFERAQMANGVWHMFGHASEVLRPKLKTQFLEVCRHVAFRKDVWYATNGLLFLNEKIRNNVQITESHHDEESVFWVHVKTPAVLATKKTPIPLRLDIPERWGKDFRVEVNTSSGKADIGQLAGQAWIDIFDSDGEIAVSHK